MDKSLSLYSELSGECGDILEFVKNINIFLGNFSKQFEFHKLNNDCYLEMYLTQTTDKVLARQKYFEKINNLEKTCKECWKFYLSPRNKSIKGLDVQLGKKFELKLLQFLNKKGIICKKADESKKIYPDNVILNKNGEIIAFLEVKYQSSPWLFAYKENMNKECYESSPALDIKKLEQQYELIKDKKITKPIYYVYWLDMPCIKGIFYISIDKAYSIYKNNKPFQRKLREGDFDKSKNVTEKSLQKIHISIYSMKSFKELLESLGG